MSNVATSDEAPPPQRTTLRREEQHAALVAIEWLTQHLQARPELEGPGRTQNALAAILGSLQGARRAIAAQQTEG